MIFIGNTHISSGEIAKKGLKSEKQNPVLLIETITRNKQMVLNLQDLLHH